MSTKERLVGLQPTAESFGTDTRSAGKFGFSTGFHGYFESGILSYELRIMNWQLPKILAQRLR
jgi:hypothetical protein